MVLRVLRGSSARRSTTRESRLSAALLVVAAAAAAAAAAARADEPGRVLVVVRSGALAAEEVSPRSGGGAPVLWELTREGASVARIEPSDALAEDPGELLRTLLETAAGGDPEHGDGVVLESVHLGANGEIEPRGAPVPETSRAGGLRALREALGRPPPPSDEELRFLERFLAALGRERSLPVAGAEPPSSDVRAAAFRSSTLHIDLVRVTAYGASAPEVAERDELLERWKEAAGPSVALAVLDLPALGAGRLLLHGRGVPAGRVYTRVRSWRILGECVKALGPDSGDDAGDVEEVIDGMLR